MPAAPAGGGIGWSPHPSWLPPKPPERWGSRASSLISDAGSAASSATWPAAAGTASAWICRFPRWPGRGAAIRASNSPAPPAPAPPRRHGPPPPHPGVTFACADVTSLPVRAGSADLLLDRGCFHYLPAGSRGDYAEEAARVLRPGGRLLLRMCLTSAGVPNGLDEQTISA